MKNPLRTNRPERPSVAYLVATGAYDDYWVECVCADLATARQRARHYNRTHRGLHVDARARVEEVEFVPARTAC